MGPGSGMHFQGKTLAVQYAEPLYISIHTDCHLAWCCFTKLSCKSNTWKTSKQSCSLLMQTILKAKAKQHLAARPLPLRCLPANLKMISEVPNWLLSQSLSCPLIIKVILGTFPEIIGFANMNWNFTRWLASASGKMVTWFLGLKLQLKCCWNAAKQTDTQKTRDIKKKKTQQKKSDLEHRAKKMD